MRLQVIDAVTQPAHIVNEDGWVGAHDRLWVFDGASGLTSVVVTDGATDAAWLVQRASAIIEQRAVRRKVGGLLETLAFIVRDIGHSLLAPDSAQAHQLPSASLAAVALEGEELHALTLGDCRLLLQLPGGSVRVIDDASVLDRLDRGAIELLAAEQRRSGADLDVAREAISDLLRSNRDRLNSPDGYRALAPGLDVSDVAQHRIPVVPGTMGLLVSDGFYRLVDTFHLLDPDGLMDTVTTEGTVALLQRLRAVESDDPEGHCFPRLKRSDDATAVFFEVVAG